MPNWRRNFQPGGSYFFTVVTANRHPVFASEIARSILGDVLRGCQQLRPFSIDAIVLLPDHLHTIWSLPRGDVAFSSRWGWIKKEFTKTWLSAGGSERLVSRGQRLDGRRGIWQSKFWEHTLESEEDFERHFDYIHYNPVKHGLVQSVRDWPASSFHRWVEAGVYPENWGGSEFQIALDFKAIERTVGES